MNDDPLELVPSRIASSVVGGPLLLALAAAMALGGCARKKSDDPGKKKGTYGQLAQKLEKAGRLRDAKEVRRACAGAAKRSCSCVQTATALALNLDLHKEALAVLAKKPPGCKTRGLKAEALARARRLDEALKEAHAVLKANPHDRYATYALAHVYYVKGDPEKTRAAARKAIEKGRGRVAHLLLGLLSFHQKDYPRALSSFRQMLKLDDKDVAALFNIGVVYQRQNHYRLARETYLRVLRVHPRHADSRYNLAVLTHGVGAQKEALYHLKKFRFLMPGSPRIKKLEALLKTKPRRRPLNFRRPAPRPGAPRPAPGAQPPSMAGPPRPVHPHPGPGMATARPQPMPGPMVRPRPRPRPKGQTRPVGPR